MILSGISALSMQTDEGLERPIQTFPGRSVSS